jgi:HAD superfamily phosphoserine phosphatase-like hydrolase
MNPVLILIARPGSRALDAGVLDSLRRFAPGDPRWLAEAEALELPLASEAAGIEDALRHELAGLPVDVAVVPGHNRRKQLLLADMDSTIIEQEVVDELAAVAGVGAAVSAITERTMRGELEFEPALVERVALLKGLPATAIDGIIRDRITFAPGGRTLVATMKAHGAFTAIVSGGFTAFTGHVAGNPGLRVARGQHADHRGRPPDRPRRRTDPRQGRQGRGAASPDGQARHCPRRRDRGRRRRQRHRHAASWPASASPSTASPRCAPRPTSASTTPTSPPCSISRATAQDEFVS